MKLNALSIRNFKNFNEESLAFHSKLNCITGNNGAGKTNLLDAVYYLCMGKSYFNSADSQNIKQGASFFSIEGIFERKGETENIQCTLAERQKKELKKNKITYSKIAEHVGFLPVVIITPDDQQLITGGSEERRKFIDSTICQYDIDYLNNLIAYNKIIAQRNNVLKRFAQKNYFDVSLLDTYDEQLAPLATKIFDARVLLFKDFESFFLNAYALISGKKEKVYCLYESPLHEKDPLSLLKQNREKDRVLQRTTTGVHKDDVLFEMTEGLMKKFGSQGQQKSFLIALKLAQYEMIKHKKHITPILLLDDISDKLDSHRIHYLLEVILGENMGQIFITDTDNSDIREFISGKALIANYFRVDKGIVQSL